MYLLRDKSPSFGLHRAVTGKLTQELPGNSSPHHYGHRVHLMKDAQKHTAEAVFTLPRFVTSEEQN